MLSCYGTCASYIERDYITLHVQSITMFVEWFYHVKDHLHRYNHRRLVAFYGSSTTLAASWPKTPRE